MKCPNCNSENVNYVSNTTKRGFSGLDACCGLSLFGPIGILCGGIGQGKSKTSDFWVCNNCGRKFQSKEIQKYNDNLANKPAPKIEPVETKQQEVKQISATVEAPKKVAKLSEPKTKINKTSAYNGNLTVDALLSRATIFIEDKEWEKACEYTEYALDVDAGYAEAYLIKFMAEYHIEREEDIPEQCSEMMSEISSLFDISTYNKASRFGNDELKEKLIQYNNQTIYNYALYRMDHVSKYDNISEQYRKIAQIFDSISEFKDSVQKAQECLEKAQKNEDNIKKQAEDAKKQTYLDAVKIMEDAQTGENYIGAMDKFGTILSYSDSKQKYEECRENIYRCATELLENAQNPIDIDRALYMFKNINTYQDSKSRINQIEGNYDDYINSIRKKQIKEQINILKKFCQEHKKAVIIGGCACLLIILLIVFFAAVLPKIRASVNEKDYSASVESMENKQYEESEALLSSSTDYQDSNDYKDSKESAEEAAEKLNDSKPDVSNMGDVSIETNIFNFYGGYIEYTEYTYYDEYTKYTSFSAEVVLDGHPDSESNINSALAQIGHIPTETEIKTSKAPEEEYYGMMKESSILSHVYAENNFLFISVSKFYDGGGGVNSSYWSEDKSYVFDISTGKQITIDKIFNNFSEVKQLADEYADTYIDENISPEDRSTVLYYGLDKNSWYTNGDWFYDGENLTIDYILMSITISASEIRPYFSSSQDSGVTSLGSSSKLADIVGPGFGEYDYMKAPDITVDVSLANISELERTELMNDLKYDINMHELLLGNRDNYFYNVHNFIGTDEYGETEYYLLDDSIETILDNACNSFSESFIPSYRLTGIMLSGEHPRFMNYEGYAVWCYYGPSPSEWYDYSDAGVVSYSDTKAEIWIAYSSPIETTFDVRIFSMIRNNADNQWKIDKVQDVSTYGGEITYNDRDFFF